MYQFSKNISSRVVVVILFFLLWASASFSQVYPYINYSVRQGLVNSNVYAMTQDEAGYIWLGTENGLSRFDGINFKNFTLEQLGLESYISSLIASEGKIIFASGGSDIFKFDPVTENLTRISKKSIIRSNQLIIKDDLLVSLHENRGFDFLSLSSGEMLFEDIIFSKKSNAKALSMLKLKDETILMGRSDGLYQLIGTEQQKVEVQGLGNTAVYSLFEDGNSLLAGGNGIIFRIVDNHVVDTIHAVNGDMNMIRNIRVDSNRNIWFNIWGSKDIYMMSDNIAVNVSVVCGIKNGTITGILLESSGTICASGVGNGLYVFGNNHLLVYPESENLPNANIHKILKTGAGGLLMGTNDGLAYLDPSGKNLQSVKHWPEKTQYIRDIIAAPGNQYLVATINNEFASSFSKSFSCNFEDIKIRYSHCSSIRVDSGFVEIGNWDNKLIRYNLPDFYRTISVENIFKGTSNTHRINCMLRDDSGKLWIGSQKGLCIITDSGKKIYPIGTFQEEEVHEISNLTTGKMLVVSNNGFYIIQNNADANLTAVIQRTPILGTNCVATTGINEFLAGTSYGLLYIRDQVKSIMTIQDGALSENINDIFYDPERSIAWVATSEGLMQVNLKILRNQNIAPLEIKQITIIQENKSWLPETINTFSSDSNSFRIKFQAFYYHNPQKIKYQYKVDEGEWLTSQTNEIQFASMRAGSHKIWMRAGLSENKFGPAVLVNITVLPPYYQTWWFILLALLTGTLLVYLIVKRQTLIFKRKQDEKLKTEQKIVELQQKALASNLNPHFVFNSLNAIQHFINSNNPDEANNYLAKFSRLMRMHLNMAEKSAIQLHEEILRLEFYLSLEQMRFEDKMSWSLLIDPGLDTLHLEIPNMIIQPFVENAIWHGLMPANRKGIISLVIKATKEGGVAITITDNGVGLHYQHKPVNTQHESKGTRLIRERLVLLDPKLTDAIRFEELSPGTRVHITLSAKMCRKTDITVPVSQD